MRMALRVRPRSGTLVVSVALMGLALTGCSSSDDSEPRPDPSIPPTSLATAWTTTIPGLDGEVHITKVGRSVVASGSGVVARVDSATGRARWGYTAPGGTCDISRPNAHADVAIVLGRHCATVALIDGATGKIRWRTTMPPVDKKYDDGTKFVSLGERSVTVITQLCGQVTRLAVRDGHRLGTIAPADRACANGADSDGKVIAVWHDPDTAETPDDHGTGWIPPNDGTAAYELYDADSGRLLWRRQADRLHNGLDTGAVVSSSPLVLAIEQQGHEVMRRFTRSSGRPGAYVGRQLSQYDGAFTSDGVAEGVMVGDYTGGQYANGRIHAMDLASGKELWSRDIGSQSVNTTSVVGVDENGVLTATLRTSGTKIETWLGRLGLHDGTDLGYVGYLRGSPSVSLVDGAVYAVAGGTMTKAPLPPVVKGLEPPTTQQPEGWQDSDVRPDPLVDPCTAISSTTLRLVGLGRDVGLPTPADCTWQESAQPRFSSRLLRVTTTVAAPSGPAKKGTAVGAAQQLLKAERTRTITGADSGVDLPVLRPVPGLGDEAYAAVGGRFRGTSGIGTVGKLVVRDHNVVVQVEAAGGQEIMYPGSEPASPDRLEQGLLGAAREALGAYGLTLKDLATAPSAGAVSRAPDVCRLLDSAARRLGLPAAVRTAPKGAGQRLDSCSWNADERVGALAAHVYAAAGSGLTGRSGAQVASQVFAASSGKKARTLPGFARAAVDHYRNGGGDDVEDSFTVTAVAGNVVVQVEYERHDGTPAAAIKAEAVRLGRTLLRASRG